MFYRQWCWDPCMWRPNQAEDHVDADYPGLKCLKTVPDVNAPPDYVQPSLHKLEVSQLKRDLPGRFGARIPADANAWWQYYIDSLENLTEVNIVFNFVSKI
ncbi:PREDICTED: uncharacterized protein LOC106819533 [Priapulus caudatus]|uniref:Uncharacterized protein LOC106819533 n=1 Tax=Priapulus caudatus TaxID=37621 RepID=A0ABM1F5B6_PRICU|nr:PREDICTED: uncharacterized protein LOC106819533 [Priapulus caudatus]